MGSVGDIALTIFMVFGPTIGYFLQYNMIRKTKSIGSFSTDVCAILIFSNIFRVFFWFGKRFEQDLLLQSIVMIIFQLLLLRECVNVQSKVVRYHDQSFIKGFWRWADFSKYIQAIGLVWGVMMVLTFLLNQNAIYIEAVGYASVLIEACLGLPQLISNFKNKSVAGLSIGLIVTWFIGDLTKIYYYIQKSQPLQFIVCGALQLVSDILILGQIYVYGKPRVEKLT